MSNGQSSLTLQRSYRVNLRRDIKDRRIAGPLLTPLRGTDSLSVRCLDTCCFRARQLRTRSGHFFALPTLLLFHVLRTVCSTLRLSCSAPVQENSPSRLIRDSGVGDVV